MTGLGWRVPSTKACGSICALAFVACSGPVLELSSGQQAGNGPTLSGERSVADPTVAGSAGSVSQADLGDTNSFSGSPTGSGGAGNAATCFPASWVLSNLVINARDLGGVPLDGGYESACGQLYRGGPPSASGQGLCDAFGQLGIRTVIDLRTDAERTSVPDAPCVLNQSTVLRAPLPVPYSLSPADYLADLNTYSSIAAAFNVLGNESSYPVYFHCTFGRDRTGVLAAVILLSLGASRDDIRQEYELTAESGLSIAPSSLTAVLDDIERRGGIDAYLSEAGVPPAAVAVLRARARAK